MSFDRQKILSQCGRCVIELREVGQKRKWEILKFRRGGEGMLGEVRGEKRKRLNGMERD